MTGVNRTQDMPTGTHARRDRTQDIPTGTHARRDRTQDIPTGTYDGREPNAKRPRSIARTRFKRSTAARRAGKRRHPRPLGGTSPHGERPALSQGLQGCESLAFQAETDAPAGASQSAPSPFEKAVERRAASLAAREPRRRAEQPPRALTPCRPISGRL